MLYVFARFCFSLQKLLHALFVEGVHYEHWRPDIVLSILLVCFAWYTKCSVIMHSNDGKKGSQIKNDNENKSLFMPLATRIPITFGSHICFSVVGLLMHLQVHWYKKIWYNRLPALLLCCYRIQCNDWNIKCNFSYFEIRNMSTFWLFWPDELLTVSFVNFICQITKEG